VFELDNFRVSKYLVPTFSGINTAYFTFLVKMRTTENSGTE